MAIVPDLSGNRPNNAPMVDPAMSSIQTALRPDSSLQQNVAIGAASALSAPFSDTTAVVRIVATSACYYRTGSGALTALTTDAYLPLGVVEYIDVNPGDRIAVLQGTAAGVLSVTPMNKKAA
jgi:hypothetical protein